MPLWLRCSIACSRHPVFIDSKVSARQECRNSAGRSLWDCRSRVVRRRSIAAARRGKAAATKYSSWARRFGMDTHIHTRSHTVRSSILTGEAMITEANSALIFSPIESDPAILPSSSCHNYDTLRPCPSAGRSAA
jgi:hypothetical protein